MIRRILFSSAGDDGNGTPPPPPAAPQPATTADNPAPPPAPPDPGISPAAAAVIAGGRTERELQLEAELEDTRKKQKSAELTAAQREDEVHRLTSKPKKPAEEKRLLRRFRAVED